MLDRFMPDKSVKRVTELDPQTLKSLGVEAVIYDVDDTRFPADALTLVFRNDTDTEVTGFKVFWVAYDEEGKTKKIDSSSIIADFNDSNGNPQLYSAELKEISFPAHSENSFDQPVHWNTFTGVRAMIAWYTDASGNTIENPDFPQWQNLAFGLAGESSTELD